MRSSSAPLSIRRRYSGVLKAFLDLLPQDGLADKLVLPLATGGSQSHMLALDYALRPVLASLAPRHILPSIYATSRTAAVGCGSGLRLAPAIAARIEAGVEQLSPRTAQALARKAARRAGAAPSPPDAYPNATTIKEPMNDSSKTARAAPPHARPAVRRRGRDAACRPARRAPPARRRKCASAIRNTAR